MCIRFLLSLTFVFADNDKLPLLVVATRARFDRLPNVTVDKICSSVDLMNLPHPFNGFVKSTAALRIIAADLAAVFSRLTDEMTNCATSQAGAAPVKNAALTALVLESNKAVKLFRHAVEEALIAHSPSQSISTSVDLISAQAKLKAKYKWITQLIKIFVKKPSFDTFKEFSTTLDSFLQASTSICSVFLTSDETILSCNKVCSCGDTLVEKIDMTLLAVSVASKYLFNIAHSATCVVNAKLALHRAVSQPSEFEDENGFANMLELEDPTGCSRLLMTNVRLFTLLSQIIWTRIDTLKYHVPDSCASLMSRIRALQRKVKEKQSFGVGAMLNAEQIVSEYTMARNALKIGESARVLGGAKRLIVDELVPAFFSLSESIKQLKLAV